MLRINKADFEDPHELAKLSATAGMSVDEFKERFYYLIEKDLLYKHVKNGSILLASQDSNVAYKPLDGTSNGDTDVFDPKISPE
jgi:hypothetical protein